jgi:hypothetical protein
VKAPSSAGESWNAGWHACGSKHSSTGAICTRRRYATVPCPGTTRLFPPPTLLTIKKTLGCSRDTVNAGVVQSLIALTRTTTDPDARAIGAQLFALLVNNPAAKAHVEAALRGAGAKPTAADATGDGG